jgi:hypothetical protein
MPPDFGPARITRRSAFVPTEIIAAGGKFAPTLRTSVGKLIPRQPGRTRGEGIIAMFWKHLKVAIFRKFAPRPSRRGYLLTLEYLEPRVTPDANVLTYHNDLASTGQNLGETALTRTNVNPATFGKLYSTALDGQVYAQPLFVSGLSITGKGTHDTVFVATQHNSLYALDAQSGQVLWQTNFNNPAAGVIPVPNIDVHNDNAIAPEIGITSTPVIDLGRNTIYLDTYTRESRGDQYHYVHTLRAVDISGGGVAGSTVIGDTVGTPGGAGDTYITGPSVAGVGDGNVNGIVQFNAFRALQRSALTEVNGRVYVAFASHADTGPYHGWVMGFDAATLQMTAAWNATPNTGLGGIWQSAGGVVADAQGNLYVETGNGGFDTTFDANGFPILGDYGDSFVKLAVDPTTDATHQNVNGWGLKVVDYFTPFNENDLDVIDLDLGSGGPMLLPDAAGSAQHPHLLIGGGKEGRIYLIDRDNMGKYHPGFDQVVQEQTQAIRGIYGTFGYYNGSVYFAGALSDVAKSFSMSQAQFSPVTTSRSSDTYAFPGSTPSISANGATDGIVWQVDRSTNQVRAYSTASYAQELWTSAQATGGRDTPAGVISKFAVPTVANGLVFVGTSTSLVAYGLLASTTGPSGLAATAAGTSQIDLAWTNNSTATTAVRVERSFDGTTFTPVATLAATAASYSDTGLSPGVTYFYRVIAVFPGGDSPASNVASAKTAPAAGTPPAAPTGLQAQPVADPAGALPDVNLSWTGTDPTNTTAFLVERSTDSGATFTLLARVSNTQTSYSDPGLAPGTYVYRVRATNGAGDSDPTAPATAAIPTPPATPTDARATATGTSVTMTWTDNATNEDSYEILRRVGSAGAYTLIATLPANTTTFTETGLTPGTLYNYHIQASNISGHADFTGITITTPVVSSTVAAVDTTTQGRWIGTYGSDGTALAGLTPSLPAYAQFATAAPAYTWAASTTDPRALQRPGGTTGSFAPTWFGNTFTADLNLTDGLQHRVALYFLDWDSTRRSERVEVLDAGTGTVLDSQTVSGFNGGKYLVWNLQGHVQFRITALQGDNAVLSGLFLGSVAATLDTQTQGQWLGVYGADGYSVAGDTAKLPAYAQVTTTGQAHVWDANPDDARALQRAGGGSVAATWFGTPDFSVDVNMTDGQARRLALYFLDWDSVARRERVDLYDADSGQLLDSEVVSNFHDGTYLVWTLKGHVRFDFTSTLGDNAVLAGLFFGGASVVPPAGAATFVTLDTATQGRWAGTYGADGAAIATTPADLPAYAQVSFPGSTYVWAANTPDPRALATGTTGLAATWFGSTFTVDVNVTDGQTHRVAFYVVDWDSIFRRERIDVIDAATGTVLNTQSTSGFHNGQYLVWDVRGHVQFRFTSTQGDNAVLSGIFFGGAGTAAPPPAPATAAFVSTDATTQGHWVGAYGSAGYAIPTAAPSLPAYAQFATAAPTYTWNGNTTDPRALQRPGGTTGSFAPTWFGNTFTADLNLTDGLQHRVALYFLDWDSTRRSERIDVIDAGTGAVLDSQTVSGFNGGKYLVWNLQGHVQFRITRLQGDNAVLSGLFIG